MRQFYVLPIRDHFHLHEQRYLGKAVEHIRNRPRQLIIFEFTAVKFSRSLDF